MKKRAVILFNLGGPDRLESVRPFLRNLFNDRAIINLPAVLRYLISWIISYSRDKEAQKIYKKIGGNSPLLANTKKQALALEKALNKKGTKETRCFIGMRYWHPFIKETVKDLLKWKPDEIVLLPLYPQFSTTTTGSSLTEWNIQTNPLSIFKKFKTTRICCYFDNDIFISAHAGNLETALKHVKGKYRVLFSAHGLPKKIIEKGDPYQWQVEQTVASLLKVLKRKNLDYKICYQSKVGPLEWIGPSTEEEIICAGKEGLEIVIVPIAFVSEHSETLVELDLDYKELAKKSGAKKYHRASALGTSELFISCLADLISNQKSKRCTKNNCVKNYSKCYNNYIG